METGKLNFEQVIELEQETGNQNLYSAASELALLGAILINQDKLAILDLRPNEFFNRRNGNLFRIMREMTDKGLDLDVHTICSQMDAKSPEKNWTAFELYDLVSKTPSSMHAESYAQIIRDKAKRRKIMQLADKMKIIASDSESETTGEIAKVIDSLTENESDGSQSTVSISDALNDYHVELLDRISGKKKAGILSGLPAFDRITGGFKPGELTIVSGIPGAGKSIFAMQIALNIGRTTPCAYYSLEMGKLLTTERMICAIGKINERNLQDGKLTEEEIERYNAALEELDNRKIYIGDAGNWNLLSLKADIMKQKIRHDIQFVVLDYTYLLGDMGMADETARTTYISRGLKLICRDLNIPMLAIHSLNKDGMGEGETPSMKHLRSSGQLSYDMDSGVVLTDYIEKVEKLLLTQQELDNIKMLFFLKSRSALPGKNYILMVKSPEFPTIGEYQKEF
ncbi:MAG: replicative DNA helicase [Smithella sp.]